MQILIQKDFIITFGIQCLSIVYLPSFRLIKYLPSFLLIRKEGVKLKILTHLGLVVLYLLLD